MAMAWLERLRALRVREDLAGGYGPGDAAAPHDQALSLSLTACACDVPGLVRGRPMPVEGLLHAEGFGEPCAARGLVCLERGPSLRYRLEFVAQGNRLLRLEAERRLSLRGVPVPITVVRGRIRDAEGRIVGRATLRFDPRNRLRLVGGHRVVPAPAQAAQSRR
jgi:hypothetical protein